MTTPQEFFRKSDSPAEWERFYGNNHERIENYGIKCGGGVNLFRYHGKPLSQRLWQDLVYRFQVRSLRIYKHGEDMWTDGRHESATIILDDNSNVLYITIYP